jgi:hypothetical protein
MMNLDYKLCGMYRYSVVNKGNFVYTSNWTRNTILSSGLIELYTKEIPNILNMLSLGSNNTLSGSLGYKLSGVITPTSFININRDDIQSFTDVSTPSVKTYFITFTVNIENLTSIREFAIMSTPSIGFARNVLQEELLIPSDSILNFEYRLAVDWSSTQSTSALFQNVSSNSFYVPLSVKTYNIPGDRIFYDNAQLILNQYTGSLPQFGDNFWQSTPSWGIVNRESSIFLPTHILSSINHTNRSFSATTNFNSISAPVNTGFSDNINSFNLVLDGNIDIKNNSYVYCRLAYPLNIYNTTTFDAGSSFSQSNRLNLSIRQTWSEV